MMNVVRERSRMMLHDSDNIMYRRLPRSKHMVKFISIGNNVETDNSP